MPYLNVDEVESALEAAALPPNHQATELITCPHETHENRVSHAIKISGGNTSPRTGVYFIGGVHGVEWGSPDILIHFISQVIRSYRGNTDITLGGKHFAASQIQEMVNTLDLFVFPQVNPDGRHYSMSNDIWWRKNRRPIYTLDTDPHSGTGVDINRNYDFLWYYPDYFNHKAPVHNSLKPSQHVYIGPSAFSEAETLNVIWMLKKFPNISYFVDLHSYSELILYSWGDDENQTANSTINFKNSAYNTKRGIKDDAAYREYIPASEEQILIQLATRMRDAIYTVRGTKYTVKQSFNLYPTAGISTDYMFSRHFKDKVNQKIRSFTIEWGNHYHPPYDEMREIIYEVTAGLIEFCLSTMKALP